jgi:hypothetical protein
MFTPVGQPEEKNTIKGSFEQISWNEAEGQDIILF